MTFSCPKKNDVILLPDSICLTFERIEMPFMAAMAGGGAVGRTRVRGRDRELQPLFSKKLSRKVSKILLFCDNA